MFHATHARWLHAYDLRRNKSLICFDAVFETQTAVKETNMSSDPSHLYYAI